VIFLCLSRRILTIRLRPLPTKSFPIHHSRTIVSATLYSLVTEKASLNKKLLFVSASPFSLNSCSPSFCSLSFHSPSSSSLYLRFIRNLPLHFALSFHSPSSSLYLRFIRNLPLPFALSFHSPSSSSLYLRFIRNLPLSFAVTSPLTSERRRFV
jgi:hypothetical protein